ncbi:CDP-glycerol glycerophosphotransferase [Streptacidiphilus sp. MAP12-16]|uniref:bifunctional glycosyltransferase/CDP-glycerol:glycerophosphate glycerophosphotransferase n=1 Tax=Streptacidiphilus sp. MAP12-16 TaxID=3156300 RepID=UPI003511580F
MPRFSIVVPFVGETAYLRDSVESVLSQSFQGLELIATGDDPGGDAEALIDQYAADDRRVIRVSTPGNLDQARDHGAAQAAGEYLLLLDRDVALLPGALAALDDRLRELGDPELLLFDHERQDWLGRVKESLDTEVLAALEAGTFAAADRPTAFRLPAVTWNRVLRRDFYRKHSEAFVSEAPSGVVLAQRMLLAAEQVGALDAVCAQRLVRRRVGGGARAESVLRAGLRTLDAYRRLLGGEGDGPEAESPALRAALFDALFLSILATLSRSRDARESERRTYFLAAAELCQQLRPQGWSRPAGADGLKGAALEQGSYLRFRAVEGARRSLTKGRRQWRQRRNQAAGRALNAIYRANLHRPIEKGLVAYMAYWNRSIACNPEAIYRKAQELAPGTRGVWVLDKRAALKAPRDVTFVLNGSRAYWELMARAEFLVSNASFSGDIVKRPEQTYVQTHHGTPLKKMGLDQREYPASTVGLSFDLLLEHADQWDYSLSSNRHSTQVWERVYPSGYTTLETGYPRNDVYQNADAAEVLRIRAKLGIEPGQTAILYAPTHRDYRKSFVPPLDLERFCEGLGPSFVVLARAHYFYGANKRLQTQSRRGVLRDVSEYPSVEELALASDALLVDYSSLMFDYANLDRPIVVHAPDWEVYKASRGVYVDLVSGRPGDTPGVVTTDTAGVIEAFRSGAWESAEAAELRAAFRARFCQFDDGRAAERVVRRVFLGEQEPLPFRPLAERTPAPLPVKAHAGA